MLKQKRNNELKKIKKLYFLMMIKKNTCCLAYKSLCYWTTEVS